MPISERQVAEVKKLAGEQYVRVRDNADFRGTVLAFLEDLLNQPATIDLNAVPLDADGSFGTKLAQAAYRVQGARMILLEIVSQFKQWEKDATIDITAFDTPVAPEAPVAPPQPEVPPVPPEEPPEEPVEPE